MPSAISSDLDVIDYAVSNTSDGLYRIDTIRLLKGMFVAELDRPWSDTPLQQNGLLVATDAEVMAIRNHCRFVMVDAKRSAPDMAGAIRAAAVLSGNGEPRLEDFERLGPDDGDADAREDGGASKGGAARESRRRIEARQRHRHTARAAVPKARNDVHPSEDARSRMRSLLLEEYRALDDQPGALQRLLRWFGSVRGGEPSDSEACRRERLKQLAAEIDPRIGSEEPPPARPLRESLNELRPVHAALVAAAHGVMRQVRGGHLPQLDELEAAVDPFVDGILCSPDALRWLCAVHAQTASMPAPAVDLAFNLTEFGRSLALPRASLRDLVLIGLLAGVGKALLPRQVIEHPGVLAPDDYALMQQHVTMGVDLLRQLERLPEDVLRGIAEHHERMDGSGYPNRLAGKAIGLYGRMAGIADSFTALTSARPYANPMSVEDALTALYDWSAKLFDRKLVEHFILTIGLHPLGTLVELRNGEVAVVADHHPINRLQTRLLVMTDADKGPLRAATDLKRRARRVGGTAVKIAHGLPAGAFGLRLKDYYARPDPDDELW